MADCRYASCGLWSWQTFLSTDDLIKVLIACDVGLLSLIVVHLFKCRDIRVDLASLDMQVKMLLDQVGRDSYQGMRKMVHGMEGNTQAIIDLDKRVDTLERNR